jgi:hypothetical protein
MSGIVRQIHAPAGGFAEGLTQRAGARPRVALLAVSANHAASAAIALVGAEIEANIPAWR